MIILLAAAIAIAAFASGNHAIGWTALVCSLAALAWNRLKP